MMTEKFITLFSLIQLTTAQLFRVQPEGVRCYDINDTYTVSCEVLPNNDKLISKVILIGVSVNTFNTTDTDMDIAPTAVYCYKRYNITLQQDVFEIISQGEIAVNDEGLVTDSSVECQKSLDGIRSGSQQRITFSLRYQGHERSLGCFYQLQGIGQPYYWGHGRVFSIHGTDVCIHSNVKPPKPTTQPPAGAFIDLQLSTVILIIGALLLVIAILFLSCAYCQIQRSRKSNLKGRIDDIDESKEMSAANSRTAATPYTLHKSTTENLGASSKHKLMPNLSLPVPKLHRSKKSFHGPSVYDTGQLSGFFPYAVSQPTQFVQDKSLMKSFLTANMSEREEHNATENSSKELLSIQVTPQAEPSYEKNLETVAGMEKDFVSRSVSYHITFQEDKHEQQQPSEPSTSKHEELLRRYSSPANLTQAVTPADTTTIQQPTAELEDNELTTPLSLNKPPERVQSDCVSTKSSRRSLTEVRTASRTKSLPTNVCQGETQTSPHRMTVTSADEVWEISQAQLPGSTYMITADEMYQFFKSKHEVVNSQPTQPEADKQTTKTKSRSKRKESVAKQQDESQISMMSVPVGGGSHRRVSLAVPGRKFTSSIASCQDTIDSIADSTSNVSVYKPQQGASNSAASLNTVATANSSFASGFTDYMSEMQSNQSVVTTVSSDYQGYLGLLKKHADDKKTPVTPTSRRSSLSSKQALQAQNKHLRGLAKMVVMFNRFQDDEPPQTPLKPELSTVAETGAADKMKEPKPTAKRLSLALSPASGPDKTSSTHSSKQASIAKMKKKAKSIGILSKAFGSASNNRRGSLNRSAAVIGATLRSEESRESQQRSRSQGAILSSNTSVLTQNESKRRRESAHSSRKLQSLLKAVASNSGSKKSMGGTKLGDLMMAALAQSRTQSISGGMAASESRAGEKRSKQPIESHESDTEKRLKIARANKKAAGTKNSKIGSLLRKALVQGKVGVGPLASISKTETKEQTKNTKPAGVPIIVSHDSASDGNAGLSAHHTKEATTVDESKRPSTIGVDESVIKPTTSSNEENTVKLPDTENSLNTPINDMDGKTVEQTQSPTKNQDRSKMYEVDGI